MMKTMVEYSCDRCGESKQFDNGSLVEHVTLLNNDGWRRIGISSMPDSPNIQMTKIGGTRDLCRLCYIGLIAFIEMEAAASFTVIDDS